MTNVVFLKSRDQRINSSLVTISAQNIQSVWMNALIICMQKYWIFFMANGMKIFWTQLSKSTQSSFKQCDHHILQYIITTDFSSK